VTAPAFTCTHPACRAPSEWLTAAGRRCTEHATHDPAHAVHLAVTGRLVDALAYNRHNFPGETS
jgi:hypothetical protein